jgi:CDP-diacylglycerol---serine O-phosphatidyltransferase
VLCAALRLARFNVLTGITDRRYFIGLPSPGAAGVVAAMVIFFGPTKFGRPELFALACSTYLLAFLMISNVRYYSFKQFDLAKRHPFGVLLVAALGILIVIAYRETFPFLAFGGYALSGPVRRLLIRKREPAPPRVLRETPPAATPETGRRAP